MTSSETTCIRPPECHGHAMWLVVPPGGAWMVQQQWHCFQCGRSTITKPGEANETTERPAAWDREAAMASLRDGTRDGSGL